MVYNVDMKNRWQATLKWICLFAVEKVERTLINGESIPEKKSKESKQDFVFPVPHSQQLVSLRQTALEAFIGYVEYCL